MPEAIGRRLTVGARVGAAAPIPSARLIHARRGSVTLVAYFSARARAKSGQLEGCEPEGCGAGALRFARVTPRHCQFRLAYAGPKSAGGGCGWWVGSQVVGMVVRNVLGTVMCGCMWSRTY